MTKNFVHRRQPCTSTIHMIVASATHAMPAVKTTYELVQIPLLIGNDQFHIRPTIMPSAPAANRPLSRSASGRDRKSTRLNSSHANISYAVFCLKKKKIPFTHTQLNTPFPSFPI